MSVANLTRYAVFQNEHCDWNCGLMPQHDGPLVKFDEAMEASSNSLQQLKAKMVKLLEQWLYPEQCSDIMDLTHETKSLLEQLR